MPRHMSASMSLNGSGVIRALRYDQVLKPKPGPRSVVEVTGESMMGIDSVGVFLRIDLGRAPGTGGNDSSGRGPSGNDAPGPAFGTGGNNPLDAQNPAKH